MRRSGTLKRRHFYSVRGFLCFVVSFFLFLDLREGDKGGRGFAAGGEG